ncbi:hydrogen gas-evolving membrane-bound hydrogenase subunit E [Phytoactinopolyspora halotolerans]|uniref:DUF4040 domain-containing protein n=1 Tax=Phytoactinopolyspora halotolerans TaxID=1981512 RepID=A0A6L9SBV5_9ACTN|nr:hydrogen gas-evolving membrane-bound hydrogenase subunit E [Phytoactinopolyspora halotolerans]NEE02008.1 DUF4040 domain-containing protein [Phytoactinopolyspora halotolerans]
MVALLALHLLAAVAVWRLSRHIGARSALIGAIAPAVTLGWLLYQAPDVLDGRPTATTMTWAPELGLSLPLRLDGLALLTAMVIAAVGMLVLQYSRHYLAGRHDGLARLLVVLVLFAGSMLGLVLADHVLALYVFWELTTVCSFLLIGAADRESRRAAMQALVVTSGGGFAMLLGLLMLGEQAGDYRISAILAAPPSGPWVEAALVLILVSAVAKSAQVPLTGWLSAAMVAPTPVSAYLHAAAMVKAGVYLVARFAPAFEATAAWRPIVIVVGLTTLIGSGWWALTQHDLKRLLAFGTASQLGLMFVLLGAGTRTAALAGATMLLAHAAFKSTLFLVVGAIEHEAGTRDRRDLSGVRHTAPALVAVAAVACVSMAGLPPTLGYLGKEAAYEAFVEPYPAGEWILAGMVAGSALTVAYTLRFLASLLVDRDADRFPARAPGPGFTAAPAVLSGAGLALGLAPPVADDLARLHARAYSATADTHYELALWHGFTPALALSVVTVALGVAVFMATHVLVPRARSFGGTVAVSDRASTASAALASAIRTAITRTHTGSLPRYTAIVLLSVLVVPTAAMLADDVSLASIRLWDRTSQGLVGAATIAACIAAAAIRHRITAILLVSAVGYLVAVLFAIHGAPELALTQVLVETLTVLVILLVLRRSSERAAASPPLRQSGRAAVALAVGAAMTVVALAVTSNHTPSRVVDDFFTATEEAGASNVVNTVLTDVRALDTIGEVTVLTVTATGVVSLVLVRRRTGGPPRPTDTRHNDTRHSGTRHSGTRHSDDDATSAEER